MAGGWAQAARLPAEVALAHAEHYLREGEHSAYRHALQVWASMVPAFAMGGDPPPPPDPPED